MDVLAHGLWGGALFGNDGKSRWRLAFALGTAPDVLAFGPFLVTHIGTIRALDFPPYVYQSYNVTHSFVVWLLLTGFLWVLLRRFPLPMAAWGLHIACDIPLHSLDFFPTPYLWPFSTPLHDGSPWARPVFMLGNYAAIVTAYAALRVWKRFKLQRSES